MARFPLEHSHAAKLAKKSDVGQGKCSRGGPEAMESRCFGYGTEEACFPPYEIGSAAAVGKRTVSSCLNGTAGLVSKLQWCGYPDGLADAVPSVT
jgi:hypothetical protein